MIDEVEIWRSLELDMDDVWLLAAVLSLKSTCTRIQCSFRIRAGTCGAVIPSVSRLEGEKVQGPFQWISTARRRGARSGQRRAEAGELALATS